MADILPVIIKKDYAPSLMEPLQKEQAVEIIAEDIPEWQKEAVRKTLQDIQLHPEQLQPWEIAKYKRPEGLDQLYIQ
jgi:hypothetical protein